MTAPHSRARATRTRALLCAALAALSGCGEVRHTLGKLRDGEGAPLGSGAPHAGSGVHGAAGSPGGSADGGTSTSTGGRGTIRPVMPPPDPSACTATSEVAERKRLDLFLMVDSNFTLPLSGLWQTLAGGLIDYVDDPRASGTGVGINFFGVMPVVSILDCNAALYANPRVPVAPLPGNAAAIEKSVREVLPIQGSALLPGLEGAIQYVHGRAAMFQDEADQALVLIADGFDGPPCDVQPDRAAAAAAAAANADPPVPTYVITLVVPDIANALARFTELDQVAIEGGTGHVRTLEAGDPRAALVETLLEVQRSAESCDYFVPESLMGMPGALQIDPMPAASPDEIPVWLYPLASAAACGHGYYLNADGTRATLCPDSCALVKQQHASMTWLSCR